MPKTQKSGMKLTEWAWSFLAVIVYVNGVAPSAQPSRSTIRRRPGFPKEQIRPEPKDDALNRTHLRCCAWTSTRFGHSLGWTLLAIGRMLGPEYAPTWL